MVVSGWYGCAAIEIPLAEDEMQMKKQACSNGKKSKKKNKKTNNNF